MGNVLSLDRSSRQSQRANLFGNGGYHGNDAYQPEVFWQQKSSQDQRGAEPEREVSHTRRSEVGGTSNRHRSEIAANRRRLGKLFEGVRRDRGSQGLALFARRWLHAPLALTVTPPRGYGSIVQPTIGWQRQGHFRGFRSALVERLRQAGAQSLRCRISALRRIENTGDRTISDIRKNTIPPS